MAATLALVKAMNEELYGPESVFTAEEQAAMRRGYTRSERLAISGRMFGIYPQAISERHALLLDQFNVRMDVLRDGWCIDAERVH